MASTLQINDGGVGLDPGQWPTVWYKGGSETGVLTLNYLARTSGGPEGRYPGLGRDRGPGRG